MEVIYYQERDVDINITEGVVGAFASAFVEAFTQGIKVQTTSQFVAKFITQVGDEYAITQFVLEILPDSYVVSDLSSGQSISVAISGLSETAIVNAVVSAVGTIFALEGAQIIGVALTAAGTGSTIETYAEEISEVFVQFAGQLALYKVEQSNNPEAVNGVLEYSDNLLTVDMSDAKWASSYLIVSREDILDGVLTDTGVRQDLLDLIDTRWAFSGIDSFERVGFAANDNNKQMRIAA